MNQKALRTLEYYKIIDHLTNLATSSGGKQLCEELLPMVVEEDIVFAQNQTKDALTRIYQKGSLSFSGIHDVRIYTKRLEIGGVLGIEELLKICSLLEVTKRVKQYARAEREELLKDSLDSFFENLEPLTPLNDEIRRCIVSEDEIADDASTTLKQIRRSIRQLNDKIHNQLNTLLNHNRTYLQDGVVTMRNGRYCLPVKAEYRNQVSGMIHDQSSTGATLFVEPMAIVNINNDLKNLFLKEQEEIHVILSTLSNEVAQYSELILENYQLLVNLDFIFAKGSLAKEHNGTMPLFNLDGIIRIRKGRHPLLNKNHVVPIDIHLGEDFNSLIITGPNTGGKTVSLKTVGLFTLMGQSGLHIPANDRSQLAIFEEVYADIGDEQSIEQSLSTFSSHMTNIVSFLEKADYKSLVLFDELCTGTDPTEGAALAISILSDLHKRQIRTMATTHYSEIKIYALSTPGVENACCEFNVETLRPTYRLLIGIPGKSNAFAISGKLGLPAYIIDGAKNQISAEAESFEDVIANLESSRVTIENERLEIKQYKEEIKRLKERTEEKQDKLDTRRESILREANEDAHRILREAKEYADQTIKNFNKYGNTNTNAKEMEQERNKLREKISGVEKHLVYKGNQQAKTSKKPQKIAVGDSVKVLSLNLKGIVQTLPNAKGDLFVQMGILRSLVKLSDVELIQDTSPTTSSVKGTNTSKMKMSKSASISMEINILGKTTDEAIAILDKYLDDAYLSHLPMVRIVHGKGTGALRNAVHQHLKRLNYVKNFRLGEFGEGDAGVTIAEFE